jgi:hypothetical protein
VTSAHLTPREVKARAAHDTSKLARRTVQAGTPATSTSSTTPVTLTNTTTSLSKTGASLETPVVYGLLALLSGVAILFTARRKVVTARHRR